MAIIRLDGNQVEVVEKNEDAPVAPQEAVQVVQQSQAPVQQVVQPQVTTELFKKQEDGKKTDSEKVGEVVSNIFSAAVVATVQNDDDVKNKITDTAKQVIANKTEALKHESAKEHTASFFGANESACAIFGYDDKTTPKWQVRMMKFGAAIWFIIYYILALFSVAPIMVFMNGLSKIIKKHWASMMLAIIFYLVIAVGIPLLSTWAAGAFGK